MKPYQVKNNRVADHKINPLFIKRWSPRSLSGKKISQEELLTLFEAARWTPSSSNGQPWVFLYAHRDTKNWKTFFSLLDKFNRIWCKNAAALIVLISRKKLEKNNKPDRYNSFGAGSAWMSLALQARLNNLVAHGMAGFNKTKARKELKIPKDYKVEAMIAIGKQGDISSLPERMQKSEKPNSRKPVKEFAFEGKFPISLLNKVKIHKN